MTADGERLARLEAHREEDRRDIDKSYAKQALHEKIVYGIAAIVLLLGGDQYLGLIS